jgi:hypothetical protein
VQLPGGHHDQGPVPQQPDRLAEQVHLQAPADFGQVEPVSAAAGPLAAQREQRMRQRVHGGLGWADVHQVQPAAADYDGVQLTVDVGEFEQLGVAELAEKIGRAERLGLGGARGRGAQDALADRGFEAAALPHQRGRCVPAVPAPIHAGRHVAQGGQVGHQFAVGRWPHRGDPEHCAAPALAPLQELPGVAAAQCMPQRHVRELSPVDGGQGAQFGRAERLQVQVEQGQTAVARGQHAPPALLGLGPGGLGQPADAAGAQLAPVPGVRGGAQVAGCLVPAPGRQGNPASQQVRVDRARIVHRVQPGGHPPGGGQQGRRAIVLLPEPAQQQRELRPRRPPRALLPPEQPKGLVAAFLSQPEVACRGRGESGGVDQLGAPGRRAALPLDPGYRRIDVAQGITGQAGREQHRALVDEQLRVKDAELVEQRLGVVEVGERGGQVATGMCGQTAFLARVRILQLLTAFGPQRLDPGVVPVGPLDVAHGEVDRCSPVQGTCLPDQIAGAGEQADCGLGIPQGLGVTAQDVADGGPADQDPACRDAVAALEQGIQYRQAAPRLPGQHQGGGQTGRDIGFPVKISSLARGPARLLELVDRLTDITEVSENEPGGLVRDGGLCRGRVLGQHLMGGGERLRRPRQGQGQQLVWLPGHRGGVRDGRHLRIVFTASALGRDHY